MKYTFWFYSIRWFLENTRSSRKEGFYAIKVFFNLIFLQKNRQVLCIPYKQQEHFAIQDQVKAQLYDKVVFTFASTKGCRDKCNIQSFFLRILTLMHIT